MQKLFREREIMRQSSVSGMSETSQGSLNVEREDEETEVEIISRALQDQEHPESECRDEPSNETSEALTTPSSHLVKEKKRRYSKRHKISTILENPQNFREQEPKSPRPPCEDEATNIVVEPSHENNEVVPEVTRLVEFFENQLTSKNSEMMKDTLKPTVTHKRSQLTRKRSKSLVSCNHREILKEAAELQGDSIAHVLLDQSGKAREKKEDDEDGQAGKENASKLLRELLELFKPKLIPLEPTTVYTIDSVQYDCKVSLCDSKIDSPISASMESLVPVLPREWDRQNFRACLKKQREEYRKSAQQEGQGRGSSDFVTGANLIRNYSNVMPNIPIQQSASTPVGQRSFQHLHNMSQPGTPVDLNNNQPNLPPSTSSSEESVLTSIRSNFRTTTSICPPRPQYQAESPSEYAFRYRPPKAAAVTYAVSKTSTRDGSIFAGSICSSVRDYSEVSSSFRSHNESTVEVAKKNAIIGEATYAANALLSDLHTLWSCVSEKNPFPISASKQGLLELVRHCSYVVKEMEGEWHSFSSFYPDRKRLDELTHANRHLRERLEQATISVTSLQAEIGYLMKEKGMMATEVKELSMQLAASRQSQAQRPAPSTTPQNRSPSNCSMGFHLSINPEAGNKAIQKREEDFNSLMEFVRVRGNDMHFYKEQLEQYDKEVDALHRTIEVTKSKQVELEAAYGKLTEENKTIVRERGHYEQILKLILQEKKSDGSSLYDLLQTLISKLTEMGGGAHGQDNGLMDGALQAVQEQNSNYRDEIQRLKEMLSKVSASCLDGKCQEEARRVSNDSSLKLLEEKNAEVKQLLKFHEVKYGQLQEIHDHVSESKVKLDKAFADKSRELKKTIDELSTLQKVHTRQQRKIQELHKLNISLTREVQEKNHNLENLNKIVSHLRSTLNEKTDEWNERVRMNGEEAIGMKDQCKWLQGQIDLLTQQLADAHERMKAHERDKGCLAQQVMNAEEERKVIDRKLQELRSAFQGDSALRKALMERNEALQVEIARLRRSKFMNLDVTMNKLNEDSEYDAPPSEMSTADPISLFQAFPPDEKHGPKKTRYTTSAGYEELRAVASTHSACDRLSK